MDPDFKETLQRDITNISKYVEVLKGPQDYSPKETIVQKIQSFENDKEELTSLTDKLDHAEVEREEFMKLFEDLRKSREDLRQSQLRYEDLNEPMDYSESKQKQLFEKCFGLEFKITEDKALSVVFHHLVPSDKASVQGSSASMTLDIDDHQKWQVIQMNPVIHGVRPLLEDLNKTADLTKFCKSIRLKFKDSLMSEAKSEK